MDRRMRTNLMLLAVLAVLGLVLWLVPEPADEEKGEALFGTDAEFSRIEVLEHGETRLVLERQGDGWLLREPFVLEADDFQVNALVSSLRQPVERSYALSEADPAELGLVEPRWKLRVDGEEIVLGGRGALGNTRYLQKDDRVYLASDVLSFRLGRDPFDYASRKLIAEGAALTALELPAGERVERSEQGWQLVPENDAVSTDDIQALVDAWKSTAALDVRPPATEKPEGESVVIRLESGETLRYFVHMNDDGFVLLREDPPLAYEMLRDDARRLLQLEVTRSTVEADEAATEGTP